MLVTKSSLSFLLLALMLSVVSTVQGDGTVDESCPNELAAYQGCASTNQATCETACENVNVEEPNFSPEDMLSMMTDPNYICSWLSELMCSIQQCCNPCITQANAYFACVAAESTEDGSCSLVCSDGDSGAVDGGSDTGGAVEGGNDSASSTSPVVSMIMGWIGVVLAAAYTVF